MQHWSKGLCQYNYRSRQHSLDRSDKDRKKGYTDDSIESSQMRWDLIAVVARENLRNQKVHKTLRITMLMLVVPSWTMNSTCWIYVYYINYTGFLN